MPHTVAGVLPAGLDFPVRGFDLWVSIRQSPTTSPRSSHWVTLVGRLAPGVSVAEADAVLARIAADLEREFPGDRMFRYGENEGCSSPPFPGVAGPILN